MSPVSTWVRATDGLFYKDPVLRGEGWFLYFNFANTPELVIRLVRRLTKPPEEKLRQPAVEILNTLAFRYSFLDKRPYYASRIFSKNTGLQRAAALFLKIESPIPAPPEFAGKGTLEEAMRGGECVFYNFE